MNSKKYSKTREKWEKSLGEDGNVRERNKKCYTYTNICRWLYQVYVEKHKFQLVFIFKDSINFEFKGVPKGTIMKKKFCTNREKMLVKLGIYRNEQWKLVKNKGKVGELYEKDRKCKKENKSGSSICWEAQVSDSFHLYNSWIFELKKV